MDTSMGRQKREEDKKVNEREKEGRRKRKKG